MVLVAAIERLNETMGKTIGRLENLVAQNEAAQKATLALGTTLNGGFTSLGGSVDDLNGTFGERLQVGIAGLNAGLQGNTAGILKLLNEQQQLGLNFKASAKTFALLESSLGLSREETTVLAEVISETSKTFAVSTDKLVGSLDALQRNLPALRSAGLGGLAEVQAQLAGKLGPAMIPSLNKFMSFISDTSMDTFTKLSVAGIGDVRERLAAARGNPDRQLKIFTDAIRTASEEIKILAGDTSDFYAGLSIATDAIGDVSMSIIDIADNLDRREKTFEGSKGQFTQMLAVLKKNIFAPFEQVFAEELFPKISRVIQLLGGAIVPVVEQMADKFRTFIQKNFGEGQEKFNEFAQRIVNTGVKIINYGIQFANLGFEILRDLFNAMSPIVGVLHVFAQGLLSIFDVVTRILSNLTLGSVGLVSSLFGNKQIGSFQLDPLDVNDFQLKNLELLEGIKDNTHEDLKVGEIQNSDIQAALEMLDETIRVIADEATTRVLLEAIADHTEANVEATVDLKADALGSADLSVSDEMSVGG